MCVFVLILGSPQAYPSDVPHLQTTGVSSGRKSGPEREAVGIGGVSATVNIKMAMRT